jgi:hypothetical protein
LGEDSARGRHLLFWIGQAQRVQGAKARVHPYNSSF